MPGTAVLDTAIGLSFLFFLVALFCSAVVEAVANVLKKRAKYLLRGLRDMLDTPANAEPAIASVLAKTRKAQESSQGEKRLYQTALDARHDTANPVDRPVVLEPGAVAAPMPAPGELRPSWTVWLMGHALVQPFKQSRAAGGQTRNPSYLPASAFAGALLDFIVPDGAGATTMTTIRDSVTQLPESVPFRRALLSMVKSAGDDIDKFRAALESWYDGQMERIGGAYKRWAKRWVIVFALALAIFVHIDAISVGRALYTDGPLRDAVASAATNGTLCEQGKPFNKTRDCVTKQLTSFDAEGLPIGWPIDHKPHDALSWLSLVAGLAITAGAASFGAPFWFDSLNRLGSLRNSGTKPQSGAT